MPDNKDMQGKQDRSRVAGGEDYEVQYLVEKFKVSADVVKEAIASVGNSRDAVEEYIRNRKGE
ncbi:MAG: DUF3606 domain-containing protein [Taibaiella sp.]|nr:DUF3606 domain-containing protein [Taibaiella sp.]